MILARRLLEHCSRSKNFSLRFCYEEGHWRTRCFTSSGAESSNNGQLFAYIGRFFSLRSSILKILAWQTRRAIVSHILIYLGCLSDDDHHVKYLGLKLTELTKSRLYSIFQYISSSDHARFQAIFFDILFSYIWPFLTIISTSTLRLNKLAVLIRCKMILSACDSSRRPSLFMTLYLSINNFYDIIVIHR